MLIIRHRINTVRALKTVPIEQGVEVDVRDFNGKLILNHDPFQKGENLENYLKEFKHKFIIFEIKCEGIEKNVIRIAKKYRIENYFLLSVTYPFINSLASEGFRRLSVRFSEYEGLEMAKNMKGKIEWVWVDIFSKFPIDRKSYNEIKEFKICLVSPERWGRPQDINKYVKYMGKNSIAINALVIANYFSFCSSATSRICQCHEFTNS